MVTAPHTFASTGGLLSNANEAAIVWGAVTLVNEKLVTAPTETPSTRTPAQRKSTSGVIVKLWPVPQVTTTVPLGLMDPCTPAEATIECIWITNEAAIVWWEATIECIWITNEAA